jgi:two-component system, NarL family, nitrate/nitrite response regulator NarL
MSTKSRVLVVEDEDAYRAALCRSLTTYGHTVVGAYANGKEAVAAVSDTNPEVAIVDLMMPELDGVATIRALRRISPSLKVLVLTAHVEKEKILECLSAGAEGYLLKGTRLKDIALSVADVTDGHAPLSPEAARHLVDGVRGKVPSTTYALTTREREVLSLLAEGHSYESIAKALSIGVGTVQNHVKSLYRKLEVSSKAEAVSVAMRAGLLSS